MWFVSTPVSCNSFKAATHGSSSPIMLIIEVLRPKRAAKHATLVAQPPKVSVIDCIVILSCPPAFGQSVSLITLSSTNEPKAMISSGLFNKMFGKEYVGLMLFAILLSFCKGDMVVMVFVFNGQLFISACIDSMVMFSVTPSLATQSAAIALPLLAATIEEAPSSFADIKPALNVSPAPKVSTTFTL